MRKNIQTDFYFRGTRLIDGGEKISVTKDFIDQNPAMFSPAEESAIAKILFRLAVHKRIDGGGERQAIVVEDTAAQAAGLPVYAVMMAVDDFKKSDSPFFPNIGEFYQAVKKYDDMLKISDTETQRAAKPIDKSCNPTAEEKSNVRDMVRRCVNILSSSKIKR